MEEAQEAMKERSMQGKFQSRHFIRWGLAIFGAAIFFLLPTGRAAAQSDMPGPLPAAKPAQTTPAAQPTGQSTAESTGARPNLAGRWALNKDQSDDPRQKMHQAMGGGGYGGHGGWGGGGNGGGGGYGGGRHGRGQGEGMLNELSQLTIEQTNTSAKVTGSSGHVLALYSANSAAAPTSAQEGSSTASSSSGSSSSGGDDDYAPPAAQWRGSQLVAVAERRRGTNTQTYELSPDGKQLFVTTKMESQRFTEPVVFRLVYDPVKSNGGSSQ
jgi:hypothetical protein